MVRLIVLTATKKEIWQEGFNSKMVRLIDLAMFGTTNLSILFQFQNGAINRRLKLGSHPIKIKFQFQNGAINRGISKSSILHASVFQFQNGAINSIFFHRLL